MERVYWGLPYLTPPYRRSQTPYLYFGVFQPAREDAALSAYLLDTAPPLCIRLPFLDLAWCSLWFELLHAPSTGLTIELAAIRVWLRFKCVFLWCLQMSSMRKVNITWGCLTVRANNQAHPWGPRRKSSRNDGVLCFPWHLSHHTRRTCCDAAFLVATRVCTHS